MAHLMMQSLMPLVLLKRCWRYWDALATLSAKD